ncbi:MAG: PAS domain-containing protein [Burkholderiales bacterium]|nr:PAS domain-containing protein [Burkholderiales bacterium]
MQPAIASAFFPGLEVLSTAIVLLDDDLVIRYANPAAETLFEVSCKSIVGQRLEQVFPCDGALAAIILNARTQDCSFTEHDLTLGLANHALLHLSCTFTPFELPHWHASANWPTSWRANWRGLLGEFRPITQQLKIAREERLLDQSQSNRELMRNLAHEIKNPLGGIRGAAQLLERELGRPQLREYTQVIIKESDRLQALMDRLLAPHRPPQLVEFNIHEALERVRSLILAESPERIRIVRDYDISIPPLLCDPEQIIQALLNIARNAAQAIVGAGTITLRSRVTRQITLARIRYRHALALQIIDDGPGIPEAIRDRIFDPLISGREGGSGLGLTVAHTFINQHHGTIAFDSAPGSTCFTIMLPLAKNRESKRFT